MKPSPVPTAHACSVCGLDWKRHGEKPTLSKCVELLKADLKKARAPQFMAETWNATPGKVVNLEAKKAA